MKYDNIIIDVCNLSYKILDDTKKASSTIIINNKSSYKEFIASFIRSVDSLVERFGTDSTSVYCLFDNYKSRLDLQNSFLNSGRKAISENYKKNRKKQPKEWYNSLNVLKYFYEVNEPRYYVAQLQGLEADDLVKPTLCLVEGRSLLVTSDLDWCKYLSSDVDWLPVLTEDPLSVDDTSHKLGFKCTENNIVLYKALFGDPSDNITGIIPETEHNKKMVLDLMKSHEPYDPNDLTLDIRQFSHEKDADSFWKSLDDNEVISNYRVNLQLVSAINVSPGVFKKELLRGSDRKGVVKSLREIVGLVSSSKKFTFGNIRRPRS